MGRTTRLMLQGGVVSAAILAGSSFTYAGCTANLTADRELNIRSGPATSYQPVGRIPGQACNIRIGNCDDGWCSVNYRGIDGFSSDFYLRKTDDNAGIDEQQVIREWWNVAKAAFQEITGDDDWERLGAVQVGWDRDRSVVQLDRSDGRFDAIRMRVRGADVNFQRVDVVYGNGQRHTLNFDNTIGAGEATDEIELRGQRGRFIDRIVLVHEKAQRRGGRAEVEVWARKTGEGRQGGSPDRVAFGPNWDRLGTKTVDRGRDRDVFDLNRRDGRFNALGLRAVDNDIRIRRLRVEYGNSVAHDLEVDRRLKQGENSEPIELRGQNDRIIQRVIVVYDTLGRGAPAKLELWGRAGNDDRAAYGPNWDRLASKTVDRGRDRDVFQLSRKDGRFDALGIRVLDNDLRVRRMRVEYGNGVAHDLEVDRRINEGNRSDPIELRGQKGRFIDRVVLVYDTVGRGPKADVELWGRNQK